MGSDEDWGDCDEKLASPQPGPSFSHWKAKDGSSLALGSDRENV